MTQYHDRELWDRERHYLKLTSWRSTRSFPSQYVDLTNVCERSIQNVNRDRLNKIHYSDHVKPPYAMILRHVTRSWIYFIKQKLQRIIQINQLFSWWMMDWIKYTYEQFWFLWFSWAMWPNWNENQIFIYRSFTIPVLVIWNEKKYLLYIWIYIYICIFVGRGTDVTVNEEEVDQEVLIRERVSKRCSSDIFVIRELYGRDRHHVITKTISLRRRDIETMNYNRIMYRTENPSLTNLDGVAISIWVRSISSVQCIITTIKETCPLNYFFCNVCRLHLELDEWVDWYQEMMGYTKVFERDKKKFVSSWKHVRISIHRRLIWRT